MCVNNFSFVLFNRLNCIVIFGAVGGQHPTWITYVLFFRRVLCPHSTTKPKITKNMTI